MTRMMPVHPDMWDQLKRERDGARREAEEAYELMERASPIVRSLLESGAVRDMEPWQLLHDIDVFLIEARERRT